MSQIIVVVLLLSVSSNLPVPETVQAGWSNITFLNVNDFEDYYDWDYLNNHPYDYTVQIEDASGGDIDTNDDVSFWVGPGSNEESNVIMNQVYPGSYSFGDKSTWLGPGTYGSSQVNTANNWLLLIA